MINKMNDGVSTISFKVLLSKSSPMAGIPTHINGHVTVNRSDIIVALISRSNCGIFSLIDI